MKNCYFGLLVSVGAARTLGVALLLAAGIVPRFEVNAAQSGDFEYAANQSAITITRYTGANRQVEVPGEIDGLPVTCIGAGAFYYATAPRSITLPGSVTAIEASAFAYCDNLTNVFLGKGVASLGSSLFERSYRLLSVTVDSSNAVYSSIDGVLLNKSQSSLLQYPAGRVGEYTVPDTVCTIESSAFYMATGLTSVVFGSALTNIGYEAFHGCRGLTNVAVPDSVVLISYSAFAFCWNLHTLSLGNRLKSVYENAFRGCSSLSGIVIPDSVLEIGADAFSECSAVTNIILGENVRCIRLRAFSSCVNVGRITLPKRLSYLDDGALPRCWIEVDPQNSSFSSLDGVLFNNDMTTVLQAPLSLTGAYSIPETVLHIDDAFTYCAQLQSVRIPQGVVSMDGAFLFCRDLTNVIIAQGVKSIGEQTFSECESLASVSIPNSVTNIGANAFADCCKLTSIEIPTGVLGIGKRAFNLCQSLTNVVIPDSVTNIGVTAFGSCINMASIKFGAGISTLPEYALQYCSRLTNVMIPNSIVSVGKGAFYSCESLPNILIPDSVRTLGSSAFANCTGLKAVLFCGNAPACDSTLYASSKTVTNYCLTGATGWGTKYADRPVRLWTAEGFPRVQAAAGDNGSVAPVAVQIVSPGGNARFSATPASGHDVNQWLTNGALAQTGGNVFILDNILADVSVLVTFRDTAFYSVTPTAGEHGAISPSATQSVASGGSVTFSAIPDAGYEVERWLVDGNTVQYGRTNLTLSNIQENHSVQVVWQLTPTAFTYRIENDAVTITGYSGAGGDVIIPRTLVSLPVTGIGDYAFSVKQAITSITMPDSLNTIGSYAFSYCRSLKDAAIPASVTNLDGFVFYGCAQLTNITVDASNAFYSSAEGVLLDKSGVQIIQYPSAKGRYYAVPSTVRGIGSCAFSDSILAGVEIGDSVSYIGSGAFSGCSSLTNVTIPSAVAGLGAAAFVGCSALTNITVEGENSVYSSVDGVVFDKSLSTLICYPSGRASQYVIPETTKNIGEHAFRENVTLTNVVIGNSVTNIGSFAFKD